MVAPEIIQSGLRVTCKRQLLKKLSEIAATAFNCSVKDVFRALSEREQIGCTGIGGGVAIPHIRMEGINKVTGIFVTLREAIDFDAYDEEPVDLVYLLLAPKENVDNGHLQALSRVSRMLRDDEFCQKMREINAYSDQEDAMMGQLFTAA